MPINFDTLASTVENVNTGNLGDDILRAERIASAGHKRSLFGKAWDVGDQGTVFYPFRWVEADGVGTFRLHTAAFFGHDVSDAKVMGTSFLRSNSVIDENFNVIGTGDLAYQFSRIAPLLVAAEKEKALAELSSRDWSILGDSAYQAARKQIEAEYDTKENLKAKKPLIGKLRIKFITECVYVHMDANSGEANFKPEQKTGLYIQEARDARRNKLNTLANDPNMGILAQNPGLVPTEGEIYFLEVMYNFTSAKNNKAEAGRTDPQGIAYAISIKQRYPDCVKQLNSLLEQVPKSSDAIAAHMWGMAPVAEESLKKKLQSVLFNSTPFLPYLGAEEKDRLVASASLFDYLRIAPKEDPDLDARLTAALGHKVGEVSTTEVPNFDTIMGMSGPDFAKQPVSAPDAPVGLMDGDSGAIDIDLNLGLEG